jgi:DNA-binding SARP family transcriptional activator/TolB-like protein
VITFALLGSIDVRDAGGGELSSLLRRPKRVALLSYLAAAVPRGFHSRDMLTGLFWPESTQEQARHAMSQALHVLRQELGEGAIVARGETEVALNEDVVSVDVWEFDSAVADGDHERVVSLYRGPLLNGFAIKASAEFEHWLDGARAKRARNYVNSLERLAEAAAGRGDWQEAAVLWRRLVEHDPYATHETLCLMRALEAAGDRAGALEQAEHHAALLRDDLSAEPSPDVMAYAERLRGDPVRHVTDSSLGVCSVGAAQYLDRVRRALEDRYYIERELGSGGMATVYLADDLKHERKVAVKVLRPELAASIGVDRFLREIKTTANLNHPHILPLLDSGSAGGEPTTILYYVMPYVAGESLRDRLKRERQLPVEDALRIVVEVTEALGAAHEQRVVHRDIKPENILLHADHAVVADFGVARAISDAGDDRITGIGTAVGTPAYMSPEQASGEFEVDGRSDLYSLGCVLYEMLAGEPPFTGPSAEHVIRKHLSAVVTPVSVVRPNVPEELSRLVERMLAKATVDRYQTARELTQALAAEQARAVTANGGVTPPEKVTAQRVGRRRWMLAGALVGAAAVIAAIALVAFRGAFAGAASPTGAGGVGEDVASRRIVVVPLENRTKDPDASDWGLIAAEFATRAIDRGGTVVVVPASFARDHWREIDAAAGLPVVELARRTEARYAVAGSYAISTGHVRFDVELVDAETGGMLRALDPVSGPVDSLEYVIGALAEQVTVAVAALLDPDRASWIAQSSMAPSLEVLRGYMTVLDVFCQSRWQDAIDLAQPFIREVPDYWRIAYLASHAYLHLGREREADSVIALIDPLLDRLATADRLQIEWTRGLNGDLNEATRAGEQLYRLNPKVWGIYAAYPALRANRLEAALERLLAHDVDTRCYRDWVEWWEMATTVYHLLGRYDEELAVARNGLARFPSHRSMLDSELRTLVGLGRLDAVDSLLAVISDLPVRDGYPFGLQLVWTALELKTHEHNEEYEATIDRTLGWFASQPASEMRFDRGRAFYYSERWSDADTLLAALIGDEPENVDYRGFRGVTLAHLGRTVEAMEADHWLAETDQPYLRGLNTRWRAAIAAALGDRALAVRLLQQAIDEGVAHGIWQHRDPEWEPLRDYRPWQELMRPKG